MHRWHGYCMNRLASPLLLLMSTNIPILVTIPGFFACISPTLITMEATSPMEP